MASAQTDELFNCTVEEFFKIISDYENYPRFLDEVKTCTVLKEQGNKKLVEFHVQVIKEFRYRLWLTEEAPHAITWMFDSGDIFKVSNGSWDLKPEDGKCRAHYAVEAKFKVFVPGPIGKALVNVNLPNMMANYHKRVGELYGKG